MFWRKRKQDDFNDEVEAHIALEADRLKEQGLSAEEAQAAARRAFGNITQAQERFYESNRWRWWDELRQNLRYGLRQLRRNPGFTTVAVLTLALGIGANTAIFSVVNIVLLRPLPYKDPDRLVWVIEHDPENGNEANPSPDFAAWRENSKAFQWIGGLSGNIQDANFPGEDTPARVAVTGITVDFFRELGVQPILGRLFTPDEGKLGQDPVALLSEGLWRNRFGEDRHVLGETIRLDGTPYTVVGVMPGTLRYPQADVYVPIALNADYFSPHARYWGMAPDVVGRLRPGVNIEQAQADLTFITHRLDREYPPSIVKWHKRCRVEVTPLHQLFVRKARLLLLILLGAVGSVLLIACANVANLLLSRAVVRGKELAVRIALGSGRPRLVRQLLTESMLLVTMGGLLGSLAGLWCVGILKRLIPPNLPSEIHLDPRVLGFVIGIAVVAVILFGLVPALVASRPNLNERLKEGGVRSGTSRETHRLRSVLVVGEIALSLALLIGAGLLARSFLNLTEVHLGFEPHRLLLVDVDASRSLREAAPKTPLQEHLALGSAFFHGVLERVGALPGVKRAAATFQCPLGRIMLLYSGISLSVRGAQAIPCPNIFISSISPDYFSTMGIRLLKGRFFNENDVPGAPGVVILNESLAGALFYGRNPLGQKVSFDKEPQWKTVVGVVADTRNYKLEQQPWPEIYLPYQQRPVPFMTLIVRAKGNPLALAKSVQNAVQSGHKNQPVLKLQTMDQRIAELEVPERFRTMLLVLFALLALALAAVGIYGVIAYSVSQRTHEIGIRMALGAEKSDVLRMLIGQGLKLALIGVAIGIAGALALTRFLLNFLYGVTPTDLLTFIAVSLLLIAVALLACYIPARRAAKADPMVALRYE